MPPSDWLWPKPSQSLNILTPKHHSSLVYRIIVRSEYNNIRKTLSLVPGKAIDFVMVELCPTKKM